MKPPEPAALVSRVYDALDPEKEKSETRLRGRIRICQEPRRHVVGVGSSQLCRSLPHTYTHCLRLCRARVAGSRNARPQTQKASRRASVRRQRAESRVRFSSRRRPRGFSAPPPARARARQPLHRAGSVRRSSPAKHDAAFEPPRHTRTRQIARHRRVRWATRRAAASARPGRWARRDSVQMEAAPYHQDGTRTETYQ